MDRTGKERIGLDWIGCNGREWNRQDRMGLDRLYRIGKERTGWEWTGEEWQGCLERLYWTGWEGRRWDRNGSERSGCNGSEWGGMGWRGADRLEW